MTPKTTPTMISGTCVLLDILETTFGPLLVDLMVVFSEFVCVLGSVSSKVVTLLVARVVVSVRIGLVDSGVLSVVSWVFFNVVVSVVLVVSEVFVVAAVVLVVASVVLVEASVF